jgi:cellulose synthase/poly-beta-1,6-N-acetylglucosamine synthase-like glycosyltransferase
MGSPAQAWVIVAYACALALAICHWCFVLFAVLYRHVIYPRRARLRYARTFTPRCVVIIPCKGTPRHASRNLLAFLRQDYPDYRVIFAVESREDTAVPIIERLVAADGRASLVVAGLTSTCAQKIHNELAALAHVDGPEILVFADNDIAPTPGWLKQLVAPLSDPSVSITTGYRWLMGRGRTFGEMAHSYTNMFIYVVFASTSYWRRVGLWGGTMAIRKRDFDALDVAGTWKESVVDDLSLSQIAARRKLRSVLVPHCVTFSDDTLLRLPDLTDWIARQLLYAKAYHRDFWLLFLGLMLIVVATYALLPTSILGALLTADPSWIWGVGPALIFAAGEVVAGLLYALLGPIPSVLAFALLVPVMRVAHLVGYIRTIATWTIHWSGVRYTFDRRGKVVHIER